MSVSILTDMAEAARSYHFEGCVNAAGIAARYATAGVPEANP